MNGSSWLIVNLILLVGALSSLVVMRSLARPELPPLIRAESDSKGTRTTTTTTADTTPASAPATLRGEELWEKSLFRPERSEAPDEGEADAANTPAEKSNFELTGLAWIGKVGEAKPVAVIRYGTTPAPSTRRRVPTIPRRGATTPEPEPEKPQKLVYTQGEMIGDTGYILAEINTKENRVILKQGNEHIDLTIEFGNSDSSQRKSNAVSAEQERRRQREQQAAALVPPPTATVAGHPPAAPGQNHAAAPTMPETATQPPTPPGIAVQTPPGIANQLPTPPGTADQPPPVPTSLGSRSRFNRTTDATPGTVDRNQAQAIRERILQRQLQQNTGR